MKIYTLICEDASNIGGPMGTEYTTHVFSKAFKTIQAAKDYAEEYQDYWPEWARWEKCSGYISCDSSSYIWTIRSGEIG